MEDDVAAGHPMLAALCVSKIRPGIPARGFFLVARVLGVYSGDPTGSEAGAFRDRAAACAFFLWKLVSASGARRLVKNPNEIAPVGCRLVIRCELARQASGRVPPVQWRLWLSLEIAGDHVIGGLNFT
jgi:hypothetical protein